LLGYRIRTFLARPHHSGSLLTCLVDELFCCPFPIYSTIIPPRPHQRSPIVFMLFGCNPWHCDDLLLQPFRRHRSAPVPFCVFFFFLLPTTSFLRWSDVCIAPNQPSFFLRSSASGNHLPRRFSTFPVLVPSLLCSLSLHLLLCRFDPATKTLFHPPLLASPLRNVLPSHYCRKLQWSIVVLRESALEISRWLARRAAPQFLPCPTLSKFWASNNAFPVAKSF